MIRVDNEADQILLAKVYRAQQEQILQFWDILSDNEKRQLLDQIREIDLQLVARLVKKNLRNPSDRLVVGKVHPPDVVCLGDSRRHEMRRRGLDYLNGGKLAVLIVAGGQASRLGVEAPKGTFQIAPISKKSLFAIHCEKIASARRIYQSEIPVFIMVSRFNRDATEGFFEENQYFGLPRHDVFFFSQGHIPSIDARGKIVLAEAATIGFNPDGHGGVIDALHCHGILNELGRRGIEHISYFQVDNPLCPPVDPSFLGFHIGLGSELSTKVVRRRSATEKVGVLVKRDERVAVIEYMDLTKEEREAREEDGSLRFWAGNSAIHMISVDFVRRVAEDESSLPYHASGKIIPCASRKEASVSFEKIKGYKFEKFIFDALRFTDRAMVYEVDRRCEFAPLKNKEGEDSPESVRAAICANFASWLKVHGICLAKDESRAIEIDPHFALNPEMLGEQLAGADPLPAVGDLYLR